MLPDNFDVKEQVNILYYKNGKESGFEGDDF